MDLLKRFLWTERFRTRNVMLSAVLGVPLVLGVLVATGDTVGEALPAAIAISLGGLLGGLFWGWREREKVEDRRLRARSR
jgi:hypothetical protein